VFTNALDAGTLQALGVIARARASAPFYVAGGTAAALQLGHRVSVDLDMFTPRAFEPESLRITLAGEGVNLGDVQTSPGTLKGTLLSTNVSFFLYEYPVLEPFARYDTLAIAGLVDIALMKMTAISARGARRDFIDLYFILQHLGREHLFDLFVKKFPTQRMDLYHYARSLTYFEDAELEPQPRMLVPWDWDEIKRFFIKSTKNLPLNTA